MKEANGHVEELLDRYRTGELDAADRRLVEGHLEGCEGCRSMLAALEDFSGTIERAYAAERAARALEREPDWGRMHDAIVARTTARKTSPRRSWLARHVPQAAAAVVALVALGVLWQQGIRGPADADRALRPERPAALSDRDAVPADLSGSAAGEGFERAQPIPDEMRPAKPDAAESPDARLDNREGALQQDAAGAAAHEPAPAERAIPGMAGAADRGGDVVSGGFEARFEDRADSAAAPVLAEHIEIVPTTQKEAGPPPDLERFQTRARLALSEADSALAADALALWRDSLAPRDELPVDLRRAAEALADSLAAFLATRP